MLYNKSEVNLTKDKKASGGFYNSLGYDVQKQLKVFLSFEMEDYGKFQDLGVKGKSINARSTKTVPYKFGSELETKMATKAIDKWVKRKGIQFREKRVG